MNVARIRPWLGDLLTPKLLRLVEWLNPSKDWILSHRLHQMADHYDPRPTGQWHDDGLATDILPRR